MIDRWTRTSLLVSTLPVIFLAGSASSASGQITVSPAAPLSTQPVTLTLGAYVGYGLAGLTYTVSVTNQTPNPSTAGASQAYGVIQTASDGYGTLLLPRLLPGTYTVSALFEGGGPPGFPQGGGEGSTFTVVAPGPNRASALAGQYAFLLRGRSTASTAGMQQLAAAGSFTADGAGNITAGVLDTNMPTGTSVATPVKGTYTLDQSGVGVVTLNLPQGSLVLNLAVPADQTMLHVQTATLLSTLNGVGSADGTLRSQADVGTTLPSSLAAEYSSSFSGETTGDPSLFSGAAQFTFGANSSVTTDGTLASNGNTLDFSTISGTYTPFDSTTGRTTMALGSAPQSVSTYAVYELPTGMYFISLDPHSTYPLFAGTGMQ